MRVDVERIRADLFPTGRDVETPRSVEIAPENSHSFDLGRVEGIATAGTERDPTPIEPTAPARADFRIDANAELGDFSTQMRTLLSLRVLFAGRNDPIARNASAVIREEVRNRLVLREHLNSLVE